MFPIGLIALLDRCYLINHIMSKYTFFFSEHILRMIDLVYKTPVTNYGMWLFIVIYCAVILWNAVPQCHIKRHHHS